MKITKCEPGKFFDPRSKICKQIRGRKLTFYIFLFNCTYVWDMILLNQITDTVMLLMFIFKLSSFSNIADIQFDEYDVFLE
jgi:hypothetical protein